MRQQKHHIVTTIATVSLSSLLLLSACGTEENGSENTATSTATSTIDAEAAESGPKNVIYMIGDGMGYNTLDLFNAFTTDSVHYQVDGAPGQVAPYEGNTVYEGTDFQSWERRAMDTHWFYGNEYDPAVAWNDFTWNLENPTDSAAAGTAMATGNKTYLGAIGKDVHGDDVENLASRAKAVGKSAGVITSVPFSHATPAAFSAHAAYRKNYEEIAHEQINSDLDVIMGAGHPHFDDDQQLLETPEYEYISAEDFDALSNGETDFTFIEDASAFSDLQDGDTPEKVFGIAQVGSTLQEARAAERVQDYNQVPDLATMTTGALNVLDNNDAGFFAMIEGGAIDWTGHNNETERSIEEAHDFVDAIAAVTAWVEANSSWEETLVVITADHETGYLQGAPEEGFHPIIPQGVGQIPAVAWNADEHSNQLVPFFARGAGIDALFATPVGTDPIRGDYLDNTALAQSVLQDWWPTEES